MKVDANRNIQPTIVYKSLKQVLPEVVALLRGSVHTKVTQVTPRYCRLSKCVFLYVR